MSRNGADGGIIGWFFFLFMLLLRLNNNQLIHMKWAHRTCYTVEAFSKVILSIAIPGLNSYHSSKKHSRQVSSIVWISCRYQYTQTRTHKHTFIYQMAHEWTRKKKLCEWMNQIGKHAQLDFDSRIRRRMWSLSTWGWKLAFMRHINSIEINMCAYFQGGKAKKNAYGCIWIQIRTLTHIKTNHYGECRCVESAL